jgi:hypothetical protein
VGADPVPTLDVDEVIGQRVSLTARCASAWGDEEGVERQHRLVRQILTFDGSRIWYGSLPASISGVRW